MRGIGIAKCRCSLCGQIIVPLDDIEAKLTPSEITVFRKIKDSGEKGANGPEIWDHIYGRRKDGGPVSASIVAVNVAHIRRKIAGSGIAIVSQGKIPYSRYVAVVK